MLNRANEGVPDQMCDWCGELTDPDELRHVEPATDEELRTAGHDPAEVQAQRAKAGIDEDDDLDEIEYLCEECYQLTRAVFIDAGLPDPEDR